MPTKVLRSCVQPGGRGEVLARGRAHGREQDRANVVVRRWYRTARWRGLRAQVISEEPLCRTCKKEQRIAATTDVDHVVPHRGDYRLFWDRSNLQGLCHTCHSRKTFEGR